MCKDRRLVVFKEKNKAWKREYRHQKTDETIAQKHVGGVSFYFDSWDIVVLFIQPLKPIGSTYLSKQGLLRIHISILFVF